MPSLSRTATRVSPSFFFFNDTATTEIYTLSLHDALPIYARDPQPAGDREAVGAPRHALEQPIRGRRSEEHTSELQSRPHLVCRLLLEKKKTAQALQPSRVGAPRHVAATRSPPRRSRQTRR